VGWNHFAPNEVPWRALGNKEHGNEPSYSIKGGEFIDQPSNCSLSKKE
jgi:hypothetical protein